MRLGAMRLAALTVVTSACLAAGAPRIESETWLNSPTLTTSQLEGKVVLVEFWTFG